ncbi:MAG: hypothetical protein L6V93_16010 [Clostridiales bacterium]|nr:MAG: hypothetical protein L6V93_16010 [Clostridiales bacterium]
MFNLTDYLKIFDTRSRPKFEINDENEKLLVAFKEAGMIDNYEESSEKEGYYKIIRPKTNSKDTAKKNYCNFRFTQRCTQKSIVQRLYSLKIVLKKVCHRKISFLNKNSL